jgi:hypothetical protein
MKQYFIFLIIFQIFYFNLSQDRLVFLYTHFRHGARAPNNVNNTFYDMLGEFWDNPGELTGVGQRMNYILGLRNREKYINQEKLLSEKYNAHEIYIQSSNYNRTMESCASQLQGFYPLKEQLGHILTEAQKEKAYPPGEISQEIKDTVNEIGLNALPHLMSLPPVRMINDDERKMNVYTYRQCIRKREEIRSKNAAIFKQLEDIYQNLNSKYAESWNKYFNSTKSEYNGTELHEICDSFLSDYADKREMKVFKEKTGLDFDILYEDCYRWNDILYQYGYYGDEAKALAHVDSSTLTREVLYYMKRRLDTDISKENEDANLKDYSRPKMMMISGHDTTVSSNIILILSSLGLNQTELYHYPKYSSQFALEVRTKKSECNNYSDYNILGIYDGEELPFMKY